MATSPEAVFGSSKDLIDLLTRLKTLQESLTRAVDKNEALLEAIETAQSKALDMNATSNEATLLRNLRSRLAATHTPNAALKRDLPLFTGLFEKRFHDLDVTLKAYQDLNIKIQQDSKDLEEFRSELDKERDAFEKEREKWTRDLEQAKSDISEQNDRLTFLSQQLTGHKHDLDVKTNELASRRIAFEEEKLLREAAEIKAADGEAESLRRRLRNQALKNVQLESTLLRTEVTLHQKEEEVNELEQKNQRLLQEVEQLRNSSSKAIKQFERRTTEANKKLAQMNSELSQAQENAKRFQEVLSIERRKQKSLQHALEQNMYQKSSEKSEGLTPLAQKAYLETLSETLKDVGKKPRSAMRVEDIIRKNEVVLVENANLRAEIHKLRIENTDLIRRLRFADNNAHYMRNQVITNLHDRAELMKKLDKTEQQYKELQSSLTKQSADWVTQRKNEKEKERVHHWNEIQTISTLGASERTWIKGPSKTSSLSRPIQVDKW